MNAGNLGQKAQDALNSDKGEQVSDKVLDNAEQAGTKRAGEQNQDKVAQARDAADKRVGTE